MAIFDSHTVRYLTYYIVLRDAAQVAALQAQFPQGYQFAPYNPALPGGAAVAFNGSWSGTTDAPIAPFVNYVWSPEWTSTNNYPQDVATFTRHSGGAWGIGGDTVTYYWVGRFVFKAPDTPTVAVPPAIANIPKRRWIEGFEIGTIGSWGEVGLGGGLTMAQSRDASRHAGGMGLAMRGCVVSPAPESANAKFNVGYQPLKSWERMYLRCRQVDLTQDVAFWEVYGTAGGNVGLQARVVASGTPGHWSIAIYRKQAGVYGFKQTIGDFVVWDGSALATDGFYRIDWLITYSSGGSGGVLRGLANGVLFGTVNFTTVEGGLGFEPAFHRGSGLGNAIGNANSMYLDIDDWMGADVPNIAGVETLTSPDFMHGTKIALLRPTTFGSGHDAVSWPGDVTIPLQNPATVGTATAVNVSINSVTPSSILEVNTDSDLVINGDGALGCASVEVGMYSSSAAGTDGALSIVGKTTVPATIDQTIGLGPNEVFFTVDGTTGFPTWANCKLHFVKAADANQVKIYGLLGQAELTVALRLEDQRPADLPATPPAFPAWKGIHNAPYPRSPWAKDSLSPPNSPYMVFSGTYAGNSTAQDLNFVAPVHWLLIRPLTGNTGGARWSSVQMGPHLMGAQNMRTDIPNVDQDSTFIPGGGPDVQQWRYRIRLTGAQSQFNQTGVTYHYIAIADPGGRFLLNFEANYKSTDATIINKLVNATFNPELVFIAPETWAGTTVGPWLLKGPQNGAAEVSHFDPAAKVTAALTLAAGTLTSQANLHALGGFFTLCYSCFRRHDGNNAVGEPGVMAILSWTGDGSGSRTISIAPASGLRPVFAIATGDDAAGGYYRDAAHTTNTSSRYDGTSVTTGITGGGIDSISVGALLNVNLTNYNMLVLFGSATLGNGGFSPDGVFAPVQADAPADGPWGPVPDPSTFNPVVPPAPLVGEPDLDLTTVLSDTSHLINGLLGGQACEFYTRKAVNIALSRIGVSKVINNLATDQTQEAVTARKHVLECVNATLRAFDWPFATAYETLVLVGGTADVPVNTDWQYSYRAPNRFLKARRIVPQNDARRGFDPVPIEFRLGSDTLGSLIFCNSPTTTDVPLVLEFTTRVSCPAFFGDPMFRDALAWRFAAELAPSLSRDEKRQQFCLAKFTDVFKSAEVPASQEQQQAPEGNASWINDRDSGPFDVDSWKRQ
jgi:hypothetical protein